MEAEYIPVYDEEYSELFKKYVLNISDMDYVFPNLTYDEPKPTGEDNIFYEMTAICIIAGIGILTNCILLLFLLFDIVFDSRMRTWSRHLLLGYHAIMLVVMLTCFTTTSAMSLAKARYSEFSCKLLTQLRVASDYAIIFSGVLLAYNVFANVYIPESLIGKKQIIFWSVLIGISWSIAQLLAFVFHTRHMQMVMIESFGGGNAEYQYYCIDTLKDHDQWSVPYVMCPLIPFGLSVTMALVSVVGLCIAPPRTNLSKEPPVMSVWERRKSSGVFGIIFVLFSPAMSLPIHVLFTDMFIVKVSGHYTEVVYTVFWGLFPFITLILGEIRAILRKTFRNHPNSAENTTASMETQI